MPTPTHVNDLQQALGRGGMALFKSVPKLLVRVLEEQEWKQCADKNGKPFESFNAFVVARLPQGLESSLDHLMGCCKEDREALRLLRKAVPEVASHAEAGAKGGRGKKAIDNIKSFGGTDPRYTLARLKRDRPDLAAQVEAGKLSANAAAIQAGFRKQATPLDQLRKAWKKASVDERETFLSEVSH